MEKKLRSYRFMVGKRSFVIDVTIYVKGDVERSCREVVAETDEEHKCPDRIPILIAQKSNKLKICTACTPTHDANKR